MPTTTITPSGRVQQGKTSYIGNAVVPGTQKTANQIVKEIRNLAVDQGVVSKGNTTRSYLTVNETPDSSMGYYYELGTGKVYTKPETAVGNFVPVRSSGSGRQVVLTETQQKELPIQLQKELDASRSIKATAPTPSDLRTYTIPQNLREKTIQTYGKGTASDLAESKRINQDFQANPYITRKPPTVTGYTQSGKEIYGKGEVVVVTPYVSNTEPPTERAATQEEKEKFAVFEKANVKDVNVVSGKEALGSFLGVEKVFYDVIGEKASSKLFSKVKDQPRYNPEDYLSYKELIKSNPPAAIRKASYGLGDFAASALKETKLSIVQSPAAQAKIRSVVGETALWVGFSPALTTTAQTAVKLNEPTKVKALGVSQNIEEGKVRTQMSFSAEKAGTRYVGKSQTISKVTPLEIGGRKIENVYRVVGTAKGGAARRALEIPKGLVYKDIQIFLGVEKGFGMGNEKVFGTLTKGLVKVKSVGVGSAKGVVGYNYYSGGIQATTNKGVSAVAGGTVSSVGSAQLSGLIFRLPDESASVIKFIPIAAKGGQVSLTRLAPTITTLSVPSSAGLTLTRNSIEAFASTIPGTAVTSQVSAVTPSFNIFNNKETTSASNILTKQSEFISPKLIGVDLSKLNSDSSQVIKSVFGISSIQTPLEATKSLEIQTTPTIQEEKTSQKQKQVQRSQSVYQQLNIKSKPFIPPITSSFGTKSNIIFPTSSGFEAFAFKSGKAVKLGTFGERVTAAKKLSGYLTKTLSASGYLKKTGGGKLTAQETGLLKFGEFRQGKRDKFLVVEEKQKRLRKSTTGKEIQMFRKKNSRIGWGLA